MRAHERELFTRPTTTATKVILPYAAQELELGGISFMVNEIRFERLLKSAVGGYTNENDLLADAELLRVMAALPSFDPFLLRERLRHMGIDPARAYFDIAEADIARMRAFVGKEIAQLVNLAFATGGIDAGGLSQRLADKLLTRLSEEPSVVLVMRDFFAELGLEKAVLESDAAPEELTKLGASVGADLLLVGRVQEARTEREAGAYGGSPKTTDEIRLSWRLIEAATGKLVRAGDIALDQKRKPAKNSYGNNARNDQTSGWRVSSEVTPEF